MQEWMLCEVSPGLSNQKKPLFPLCLATRVRYLFNTYFLTPSHKHREHSPARTILQAREAHREPQQGDHFARQMRGRSAAHKVFRMQIRPRYQERILE